MTIFFAEATMTRKQLKMRAIVNLKTRLAASPQDPMPQQGAPGKISSCCRLSPRAVPLNRL